MMTHWADEFSIIIPRKTNITWQHQTDGVACNQIFIEGLMIPIERPKEWNQTTREYIDWAKLLTNANYDYNYKKVAKIWKKIDERLPFVYKEIEPPRGQPRIQEGIKWIVIKKIKYKKDKWNGGVSPDYQNKELKNKYKDLLGKKVALLYPNCD